MLLLLGRRLEALAEAVAGCELESPEVAADCTDSDRPDEADEMIVAERRPTCAVAGAAEVVECT